MEVSRKVVSELFAAVCCEGGQVRKNNEDNFYISGQYKKLNQMDEPAILSGSSRLGGVFAVSDGMGGIDAGEVASYLAMSVLGDYEETLWRTRNLQGNDGALKYIQAANSKILAHGAASATTMGATLALVISDCQNAYAYNVGDSRIYFFSDGGLKLLSKDHTILQDMLDSGVEHSDSVTIKSRRHHITQHLGISEQEFVLSPHCTQTPVWVGAKLLICSDGLTEMVVEDRIADILSRDDSPGTIAQKLVSAANANGGRDNITALVISYG